MAQINAGYTRRTELRCTIEEMETYGAVVLYDGESIYVRQNDGTYAVKIGDGKTPLIDLPYSVNYSDINLAAEATERAKSVAEEAAYNAESVRTEVNKFFSELGVVQTMGDSPFAVMSQRASSSIFNKHDKRLTNLELGITPDPFVTDITGKVPANALPYAEAKKVGGMTCRDEATNTLKDAKVTSIESIGEDGETIVCILEIPEAVQALEGYGLGVDAEYCNYIDFENKQYIQKVKKYVVTGNETFSEKAGAYNKYSITFTDNHSTKNTNSVNLVANHYTAAMRNTTYNQTTPNTISIFRYSSGDQNTSLDIVSDLNLGDLKDQLNRWYQSDNPLTVVYKLAEPIVTDISELLPDDNFIKVEGGGTITTINEYNLGASTEIEYMLKEVTA